MRVMNTILVWLIFVQAVWDEFSGEWEDCGVWLFLELVRELDRSMLSSRYAKMLWLSLQSNYGFKKMISEWNCGTRNLWKKYLKDVARERRSKLGKRDSTCNKLVGSKPRKKRLKLDNLEIDSNSSDTVVQLRSGGGLSNVELTRNGAVSILNKSRARTVSIPLRLSVRKPNRPVVPTAGDKLIPSETLSMEENFTGYATSFPTDLTSEEEYSKSSTTSCSLSNHREYCATIPIRKGQFGKVKHREDKLRLPRSCQDNNKLKGLQSREGNSAEGANCCAEINQSIGRARIKKLKEEGWNFNIISSEYMQKMLRHKAPVVAGAKRKTSCTRRKIQKGICRSDANIKPPLLQEDGNSLQVKQNPFSRQDRQSMLFEGYGRNCGLKDMVSCPRKQKWKRQSIIQQSDTICFICHYGGEVISCKNCFSSYHPNCLGTQVLYLHAEELLSLFLLHDSQYYNWIELWA